MHLARRVIILSLSVGLCSAKIPSVLAPSARSPQRRTIQGSPHRGIAERRHNSPLRNQALAEPTTLESRLKSSKSSAPADRRHPIRPIGAPPKCRTVPTGRSARVSSEHHRELVDMKRLKPRRAIRRAGWIWLCMYQKRWAQGSGKGRREERTPEPGSLVIGRDATATGDTSGWRFRMVVEGKSLVGALSLAEAGKVERGLRPAL